MQRVGIWTRKHGAGPYLLLLPATAVIGALIVWPAIQVGLFSFQDYGLMQISGVQPAASAPRGGAATGKKSR